MDDAAVAATAARRAADLLTALRASPPPDLGARGDAAADAELHAVLAALRPGDPVLSEESADDPARLTADRVWIIDPLDGTREYAAGSPEWAVHVALWSRGAGITAAAVALPARGEVLVTDPPARPGQAGDTAVPDCPRRPDQRGHDEVLVTGAPGSPPHQPDEDAVTGAPAGRPCRPDLPGSGASSQADLPGDSEAGAPAGPPSLPGPGSAVEVVVSGMAATPPSRSDLRIAVSASRPPASAASVAAAIGARLVPMGSAGVKAMAVLRGEVDAYLHEGGQWEWDSAAPVGVAVAAGLHASRADGSPLVYNRARPYLPDLLICRPELAEALLTARRAAISG